MEGGSSTAGRCDAVTLQAREAVRWLQMVESRRYGAAFSRVGSDPIAGGHVSYAWQRKSGRNSVAKRSERGIDALVPHFARIGNVALPAASAWERQSVRPRSRLVSGETRLGALYRPRAMRRRSWTAWLVKLASPTATGNFGSRCRARWYARRRHVEAGPGRDRRLPSISVPPCADFRHMDVLPAVQARVVHASGRAGGWVAVCFSSHTLQVSSEANRWFWIHCLKGSHSTGLQAHTLI